MASHRFNLIVVWLVPFHSSQSGSALRVTKHLMHLHRSGQKSPAGDELKTQIILEV
jgi:hypothetical protein